MFGQSLLKKNDIHLKKWGEGKRDFLSYKGVHFEWKKRPYYRNINIKMYEDLSCVLTTGKSPPDYWVKQFLDKNWSWITKSLKRHQQNITNLIEQKILPKPSVGGWAPFLGHALAIEAVEQKKLQKIDLDAKKIFLFGKDAGEQITNLQGLYKKEAQKYLKHLQSEVSKKMELYPLKLSFRNQKTRWGSCSAKGDISYNWKLVAAPGAWMEYVVVHETAHLKHLDHSPEFWMLVEQYCPKYRQYSSSLKDQQLVFDFLNPSSNLYKLRLNFPN